MSEPNEVATRYVELEVENVRLRHDMQRLVSGLRSHLGDLIRRIGPARRPEDIKSALEEIHNSYNSWGDRSAEAERDKLQAFKDYCHARLDAAGVTVDPESPHKAEGCRIGGRLDEVFGERDRLREALTWAVGFIQCNLPRTSAEYPDMRNAEDLVARKPLHTGEFQLAMARAEVAEHERDQSRTENTRLQESRSNLLRQIQALQGLNLALEAERDALRQEVADMTDTPERLAAKSE